MYYIINHHIPESGPLHDIDINLLRPFFCLAACYSTKNTCVTMCSKLLNAPRSFIPITLGPSMVLPGMAVKTEVIQHLPTSREIYQIKQISTPASWVSRICWEMMASFNKTSTTTTLPKEPIKTWTHPVGSFLKRMVVTNWPMRFFIGRLQPVGHINFITSPGTPRCELQWHPTSRTSDGHGVRFSQAAGWCCFCFCQNYKQLYGCFQK